MQLLRLLIKEIFFLVLVLWISVQGPAEATGLDCSRPRITGSCGTANLGVPAPLQREIEAVCTIASWCAVNMNSTYAYMNSANACVDK